MMLFYPSKNNNRLNGREFNPDAATGRAMLNPHYPVRVAPKTRYVIDSGAFQERDMRNRLPPDKALARQMRMVWRIRDERGPEHPEAVVTYDMLLGVDEGFRDERTREITFAPTPEQAKHCVRVKTRGTEASAEPAVRETIAAAKVYAEALKTAPFAVAYAAQGATPGQYLECVKAVLEAARPMDWLALGGFCIIGRVPSLKPLFAETIRTVLPYAKARGVARAHLLGVTVSDAIVDFAAQCRENGIEGSTDSSGPEQNAAVFGKRFETTGRPRWVPHHRREGKNVTYFPADWAIEQIKEYTKWISPL